MPPACASANCPSESRICWGEVVTLGFASTRGLGKILGRFVSGEGEVARLCSVLQDLLCDKLVVWSQNREMISRRHFNEMCLRIRRFFSHRPKGCDIVAPLR